MYILKIATDWAKDEMFSTTFFILFGVMFLFASVWFWQLGKTELAKAYVTPTLVAGILLLIIGFGLFCANKSRVASFTNAYNKDATAFVKSEIQRTESTLKEYRTVVFKAIPLIIVAAALVLIFINTPMWRAISITTIAMLIVILFIDGNAHARIDTYSKQLHQVANET